MRTKMAGWNRFLQQKMFRKSVSFLTQFHKGLLLMPYVSKFMKINYAFIKSSHG